MMLAGLAFFVGSYLVVGGLNIFFTRILLPSLAIGSRLDSRIPAAGQARREVKLSALTIVIFGLGVIFPWGLLRMGWARLAEAPSLLQILIEMLALVFWNEIHFYINHRLLHTDWLRRFHSAHHRSVVTTPWTAYSFHPVEAFMLGSVLMLPMMIHDFSVEALVFVPLFSLLINSIGHANYDLNPQCNFFILQGVRRHQLHHAHYHGNYGFMLPIMDRVFGTAIPTKASEFHNTEH